jgi:PAS domain S-box-containing protein
MSSLSVNREPFATLDEGGITGKAIGMGLLFVFLVLVSIIIAVSWLGLKTMQRLNAEAQEIANNEWIDVQLASEALTYSNRNSRITLQVIVTRNRAEIDSLLAVRAANTARISGLLQRLATRIESPKERELFDAVIKSRNAYANSYAHDTEMLLKQKNPEKAKEFLFRVTLPLLFKYHSAWEDYIQFQTDEMNQKLAASATQYALARKRTIWLFVLSVLLALGIAVVVIKRIMVEIQRRINAEGKIHRLNEELEIKVRQRTAALGKANQDLGAEIAERRDVEEKLRSKTAFLEAQTNSTLDGILVVDRNNRRVLQNRRFIELFHFPQEMVEDDDDQVTLQYVLSTTKDPDGFLQKVKYLYEHTEEISRDEIEFKDGTVIDRYTSPVIGADGTYYGRIWVFRDVSERKRNEEEVRRLSVAVEQSPVSVVITDLTGTITYVNQKFVECTGYTYDEVIGKNSRILKSGETTPEDYKTLWNTLKAGKEWRGEFHNRRKSGELYWESAMIRPLRDAKGAITHFLALKEDVTEKRKLEVQLRQAQKLESIGQLAAGIAHEINTPTQYIGDNLTFLTETFQDLTDVLAAYEQVVAAVRNDPALRQATQEAVAAINRGDLEYLLREIPRALAETTEGIRSVSKLVGAMKEFSHPGSKEKTPWDLNRAIQNTITVSRHEWKYFAELETDFDSSLPLVCCLPNEFNQVILNLIVNAAHTIADVVGTQGAKGNIRIATRNCQDWAEIRIQDTGAGIPTGIQTRIFDPFFTTKDVGKGTGQGLAIARSVVVDRHKGSIHFETEEGKGTTFIVRLPFEGKSLSAAASAG